MAEKIKKSAREWQELLTREEFEVCRNQGTEHAFTGEFYDCKEDGTYCCKCCGAPLFSSDEKFDSGTGWPSYTAPIAANAVETTVERSHGVVRTEVHCMKCDAHLGHVFEDGPSPTGRRFCINSVALKLKK